MQLQKSKLNTVQIVCEPSKLLWNINLTIIKKIINQSCEQNYYQTIQHNFVKKKFQNEGKEMTNKASKEAAQPNNHIQLLDILT